MKMHRFSLAILAAVLCTLCLEPLRPVEAAASSNGLVVSGSTLLRDGKPFTVKGVIFTAFVAPEEHLKGKFLAAHNHFGAPILQAAKKWGVNTVRFNFSQPGLDPKSDFYSQTYLKQIRAAVKMAEDMGFAIIVTVQDELPSGETNPQKVRMPNDATLRANLTLVSMFGQDTNIMLDLFNEPALFPTPENWRIWQRGGVVEGQDIVGVQSLVDAVRRAGAKNVLLIGAPKGTFAGVPEIDDPMNNFVYDPHVLQPAGHKATEADWQSRWGYLADEGKPVILGAFTSDTKGQWCINDSYMGLPQQFLDFLSRKHIGVIGWAFDIPGSIVTDFNGTPTTYRGKRCGDEMGGSGEALQAQFRK